MGKIGVEQKISKTEKCLWKSRVIGKSLAKEKNNKRGFKDMDRGHLVEGEK